LGVRHAYSQAHRPKANGRAEVAGRQIISILRKLHAESNINWVEALPRALLKYHDTVGMHGMTPHQIVFGRDRNMPGIPYTSLRECEDANAFLDRMKEIDELVSEKMNKIHEDQANYFNSRKRDRRSFVVGDKVWLIKPKQVGGHKISTWWTGPFPIVQRLGLDVFVIKLNTDETMEVHSDQIKKFQTDDILDEGVPLYYHEEDPPEGLPMQIERIRDHRVGQAGLEFLVHWKGAPNAMDSWEKPEKFLLVSSQEWLDYCKDKQIYNDIHEIPVAQGIFPRETPLEPFIQP